MNQIQQTHVQSPAPLIHAWEPVWRAYKLTSWMLTDLLQPAYREVKHGKKRMFVISNNFHCDVCLLYAWLARYHVS